MSKSPRKELIWHLTEKPRAIQAFTQKSPKSKLQLNRETKSGLHHNWSNAGRKWWGVFTPNQNQNVHNTSSSNGKWIYPHRNPKAHHDVIRKLQLQRTQGTSDAIRNQSQNQLSKMQRCQNCEECKTVEKRKRRSPPLNKAPMGLAMAVQVYIPNKLHMQSRVGSLRPH